MCMYTSFHFPDLSARKALYKQGFTLIELSIVLVIIGLLVGGIFIGNEMIRQSQLRSVLTDIEQFQTAILTFRGKYNGLPGDLSNATSFFGTNPNCNSDGIGTGTETCNGNGNGWVDFIASGVPPWESFLAWQQLANAGLIRGTYTGQSTLYYNCIPNINCPSGRMNSAQAYYFAAINSVPIINWWPYYYAHAMIIGITNPSIPRYPGRPIMTADEALALDLKADDGKPGLGYWRSFGPGGSGTDYSPNCQINGTTKNSISDAAAEQDIAVYNTTNPNITCSMLIYLRM